MSFDALNVYANGVKSWADIFYAQVRRKTKLFGDLLFFLHLAVFLQAAFFFRQRNFIINFFAEKQNTSILSSLAAAGYRKAKIFASARSAPLFLHRPSCCVSLSNKCIFCLGSTRLPSYATPLAANASRAFCATTTLSIISETTLYMCRCTQ